MARAKKQPQELGRCASCLRPLAQPARGRRRSYCSSACRQIAYRGRQDGERKRRLVTLVQADARAWLPSLPSESVDLVLTDPPYHFSRGETYFRQWFTELDDSEWQPILGELYRLLRPNRHAYLFSDDRARPLFDRAAEAAGFRRHPPLIWTRTGSDLAPRPGARATSTSFGTRRALALGTTETAPTSSAPVAPIAATRPRSRSPPSGS